MGAPPGLELEQSESGILCLTLENFEAPWLLFEAGALAKRFGSSQVIPYLIDELPSAADKSPLAQFQHVRADRKGTYRLLDALNTSRETPKPADRLERSFLRWWPDLEQTLNGLRVSHEALPARSERELLETILLRVEAVLRAHSDSQGPGANLPRAELLHLLNLRDQPTTVYTRRATLQNELRHLRDLGLIKNKQPIAALPDNFQLDQYFQLTNAGKDLLKGYSTVL